MCEPAALRGRPPSRSPSTNARMRLASNCISPCPSPASVSAYDCEAEWCERGVPIEEEGVGVRDIASWRMGGFSRPEFRMLLISCGSNEDDQSTCSAMNLIPYLRTPTTAQLSIRQCVGTLHLGLSGSYRGTDAFPHQVCPRPH